MITVPIDQALAVILLEDYSTAFTREWKYCPKFSQIYSKLERNLAIEQLDWALELRSLLQAETNFIRTVEYMDKQFIEIKKARIGLFDYDLPGLDRFCDIIVDR